MKKTPCILIILILTLMNTAHAQETMKTFNPAFVHTVFFWFKEPQNKEHRAKFESSLKKFLDHSAYARTKFIGSPPPASREVVDGSFTYSLVLTFESAEAQEEYQKEEPHLLFIEESQMLWEKVIVYDSRGIGK